MPSFTSSELPIVGEDVANSIQKEFFFYSKSLNQEFIVHIRESYEDCRVYFDFYRSNGEYVYTKVHEIPKMVRPRKTGLVGTDSSFIKISPNGRYLYYIIEDDFYEDVEVSESSVAASKPHELKRKSRTKLSRRDRKYYNVDEISKTAYIFELTLVRRKSIHKGILKLINPIRESRMTEVVKAQTEAKLSELQKYSHNKKETAKLEAVRERLRNSEIFFELKNIRKFK